MDHSQTHSVLSWGLIIMIHQNYILITKVFTENIILNTVLRMKQMEDKEDEEGIKKLEEGL